MSELYLIAHKVRSEPAFDVAVRMVCPICAMEPEGSACTECNETGFWWIIPTSGHRAYIYDSIPLNELIQNNSEAQVLGSIMDSWAEMPPSLPDHYPTISSAKPKIDISGLLSAAPAVKIQRRF